jgi:hypothetical protein
LAPPALKQLHQPFPLSTPLSPRGKGSSADEPKIQKRKGQTMTEKLDVYSRVTGKIIADLERGNLERGNLERGGKDAWVYYPHV